MKAPTKRLTQCHPNLDQSYLSKMLLKPSKERAHLQTVQLLILESTSTRVKVFKSSINRLISNRFLNKLCNQLRRLARMFQMDFSGRPLEELRGDRHLLVNCLIIDQTVTMASKIIKRWPSKSTRRLCSSKIVMNSVLIPMDLKSLKLHFKILK